jgi:D-sedoheptulose 7-phosphate isomerase
MSQNIIDALKSARNLSLRTVGLTGRNGGEVGPLCDIEIRIPSESTPLIQQGHLIVGHLVCKMVEELIHPRKA